MRLSFKFKANINHKQLEIIKELSWHLTKLYNIVNYDIKNNKVKPTYTKLENQFKPNWHNEFLHSHNRQQLLKQLNQDWKSYFVSLKDYKKNSDKYKNKPGIPNFKNMNKNPAEIIFTNLAIRIRDDKLLLSLSKAIKNKYQVDNLKFQLPTAVESLVNLDRLQQIRIKYDRLSNQWYLLVICRVKPEEKANGNNIMAIDLGLNNLATITFKDNIESYIIDGKVIKSKNSYFNKELSRLQSIRMKQTGSKYFKDSKQIKSLRIKRRNYIANYLHKASFKIIKLAQENDVSRIIIGNLQDIKQNMNYNKSFVQVPIQRLADLIEYKAKLSGIEIIKVNESFTSGCSVLDLEKLNRNNYNKSRRIYRGIFQANNGLMINADVNGSLNIMRKYDRKCIPELVKKARDNGVVFPPSRLRIA